tara:strand:+ start:792 stop:974 length:183 start_codon:yes stop_codon:yes gene_type:complete
MIDTPSLSHLSCIIEAIALSKHPRVSSRERLKRLLLEKGHDKVITEDTVKRLVSSAWSAQ